jgi:hypothetical protein
VATTTYRATVMAPPPSPWTSRPATTAHMVPAVPATSRPSAKTATEASSGPTGPRRSDQFPAPTMPITPVASGPAKASAYRPAPPSSRLTTGMTVVTARDSNAARNTRAQAPTVTSR